VKIFFDGVIIEVRYWGFLLSHIGATTEKGSPMPTKKKRENPDAVRIPRQLRDRLLQAAAESGIPKNRIVVNAIDQFLTRIEKPQAAKDAA
jgi:predicted DNA-binding protein